MRVAGARHGDRAPPVAEAVAAFIGHAAADRLLGAVRQVPAALDHEVADDAVEDRAVVVLVARVLQETRGTERRPRRVDFDGERTQRRLEADPLRPGRDHVLRPCGRGQPQCQQQGKGDTREDWETQGHSAPGERVNAARMVSVPGPTGQRRTRRRSSRSGRSGKMRGHACQSSNHALCTEPHGRAAPRQRPHGALQLARRARVGRSFRAARGRHRCRPQPRHAARAAARRTALAGHHLGRRPGRGRSARPVPAERARFRLRRGAAEARGERPDLPVLLLARRTAVVTQDAAGRRPAATVCAHLRRVERGRGAATHRRPARRRRSASACRTIAPSSSWTASTARSASSPTTSATS